MNGPICRKCLRIHDRWSAHDTALALVVLVVWLMVVPAVCWMIDACITGGIHSPAGPQG